jgi:hypothetical protein
MDSAGKLNRAPRRAMLKGSTRLAETDCKPPAGAL